MACRGGGRGEGKGEGDELVGGAGWVRRGVGSSGSGEGVMMMVGRRKKGGWGEKMWTTTGTGKSRKGKASLFLLSSLSSW